MIADWVVKKDIAHSQENYVISQLEPIKDKCIGMGWGNHEYSYMSSKFGDVHAHICENLKVKNLGYSCFLDLSFRRESSKESHLIRCCGTHGSSNAIMPSGKQNILWRWMNSNAAQIYWYAHMHDIIHKSKPYLDVNQNSKIINRESLGVVTGSFYKTYVQGIDATYGERKNYPPNKIGYPVIEIDIENATLNFSEKVYLNG